MNLQPWQQQIFGRITSGGIEPKEMILMTAGRNVGKSAFSAQALSRIMEDLMSRPVEDLVLAERRVHGSRFYTVEPVGGNWREMETWITERLGTSSSVWDLPEKMSECRWIMNDRKFWFRNEADRTMFVLKWR